MCVICKTIRGGGSITLDGKCYKADRKNSVDNVIERVHNAAFMQSGVYEMQFKPVTGRMFVMEADSPTDHLTMH